MPRGLRVPVGISSNGGAATDDGDDNDIKIIKTALSDGDNDNAFQQDISLGSDLVFDISDPVFRSEIVGRIIRIFNKFKLEKRFKLLRSTIRWNDEPEEGDISISFKYLNLESDEEKVYEQNFKTGI